MCSKQNWHTDTPLILQVITPQTSERERFPSFSLPLNHSTPSWNVGPVPSDMLNNASPVAFSASRDHVGFWYNEDIDLSPTKTDSQRQSRWWKGNSNKSEDFQIRGPTGQSRRLRCFSSGPETKIRALQRIQEVAACFGLWKASLLITLWSYNQMYISYCCLQDSHQISIQLFKFYHSDVFLLSNTFFLSTSVVFAHSLQQSCRQDSQ